MPELLFAVPRGIQSGRKPYPRLIMGNNHQNCHSEVAHFLAENLPKATDRPGWNDMASTAYLAPFFTFCDFEAFTGVVEPGKSANAFCYVPHTEFKDDIYLKNVIKNETGDIHCDKSWRDVFGEPHKERYLLTKGDTDDFIGPINKGAVVSVALKTRYTGQNREQEKHNTANLSINHTSPGAFDT
ncbi:hypothetical protein [Sulfitobacter sp. MF3-043]|uniref:hypothetical protein n=1 Tax=Sulfitobacter sediminivivens TaxID=3252902 RepID=UPI003EBF7BD7